LNYCIYKRVDGVASCVGVAKDRKEEDFSDALFS